MVSMSDELTTKPTAENTKPENKQTTKLPLAKRYKKDQIVLAIGRNKGIKSAVCRELDCSIYELNHWLNVHSECKKLITEAKKELVSLAEETMLANLKSDNPQVSQRAAEFILKTLGSEEYAVDPTTQINVVSDGDAKIQIQQLFGL